MAVEVGNPADGRHAVSRLVQGDGVDLIKVVYSTIPGNVPRLGIDIVDAVIDEAHLLGRRVFAHVATPEEAMDCIAAGVDGLEHTVIGSPKRSGASSRRPSSRAFSGRRRSACSTRWPTTATSGTSRATARRGA